jgi:hypothetical protein
MNSVYTKSEYNEILIPFKTTSIAAMRAAIEAAA